MTSPLFGVRLSEYDRKKLDELAERYKLPRGSVVKILIRDAHRRETERRCNEAA